MITGDSGSRKTNSLFDLICHQPDIDKIYLYTKDTYESKYQFLINKRESAELKQLNHSKAFIVYSKDMDDIYENIEEYKPNKKRKILIIFDDMILDMFRNKKHNLIVNELLITDRKLNVSLAFIVPESIRLNSTSLLK